MNPSVLHDGEKTHHEMGSLREVPHRSDPFFEKGQGVIPCVPDLPYCEFLKRPYGQKFKYLCPYAPFMPRCGHGRGCGPGRMRRMRSIAFLPDTNFYKPHGVPAVDLEIVIVSHEELEAIRLVDFLGLEQEEAARRMDISRKALAGDLKKGRYKIADAVLHGKGIRIEGGDYIFHRDRTNEFQTEGSD